MSKLLYTVLVLALPLQLCGQNITPNYGWAAEHTITKVATIDDPE
jgi:hypothetical protein